MKLVGIMRSKLVLDDYFVAFSAALFMVAHSTTMFIRGYLFETARSAESAEVLFQAMEANPILAKTVLLGKLSLIFSYLLVPALVLTTYVIIRRTLGKKEPTIRSNVALIFFFVALINASNDISILLGLLA